MNDPKPNAEQSYKTLLLIWVSLVISQLLFVAMVFVIKPEVFQFDFSKDPLAGDDSMSIVVLAVIGFGTLVISFHFRKLFQQKAVAEQNVGLVQTAMIIACALCESTSLLGLVAAFAFNYQYFFIFSAAGIVGTLLHIPKLGDIYEASFRPRPLK